MSPKKTTVRWQFNRGFRFRLTFTSRRQAIEYCSRVKRLWGITPVAS